MIIVGIDIDMDIESSVDSDNDGYIVSVIVIVMVLALKFAIGKFMSTLLWRREGWERARLHAARGSGAAREGRE